MALAEVGFFTALTEAVAATIGAGMFIGGFVAGGVGIVLGWGRPKSDEKVLQGGYLGGAGALLLALLDFILRYGD